MGRISPSVMQGVVASESLHASCTCGYACCLQQQTHHADWSRDAYASWSEDRSDAAVLQCSVQIIQYSRLKYVGRYT